MKSTHFKVLGIAATMIITMAIGFVPISAGADTQQTVSSHDTCPSSLNASATSQYHARPIPGMTLQQVVQYFDARNCSLGV